MTAIIAMDNKYHLPLSSLGIFSLDLDNGFMKVDEIINMALRSLHKHLGIFYHK